MSSTNAHTQSGPFSTPVYSQAENLEGATMPDGQKKYKDWLKDRGGREEDKKNNSSSLWIKREAIWTPVTQRASEADGWCEVTTSLIPELRQPLPRHYAVVVTL